MATAEIFFPKPAMAQKVAARRRGRPRIARKLEVRLTPAALLGLEMLANHQFGAGHGERERDYIEELLQRHVAERFEQVFGCSLMAFMERMRLARQ